MSQTFISADQELRKGDFLLSNDGNYKAIFQDDGSLVVYKWSPIWTTDTVSAEAFRVLLQQDTNLVMYTKEDRPVWDTGTYTNSVNNRMRLTLTDQGFLVVDNNGQRIWTSENSRGIKH
ncbi:B-type lectin plumieribetin-like [Centroberyx gerrardi]|uniref:B-type lectin plumieribetin-like n=1 Tax=Centroberyx gerrardi TaxID=166262 RepID=UPI003AAE206A